VNRKTRPIDYNDIIGKKVHFFADSAWPSELPQFSLRGYWGDQEILNQTVPVVDATY